MNAEFHQARYFQNGSLKLRNLGRQLRREIPHETLQKFVLIFSKSKRRKTV
jgi:hypothetical protein